MDFLSLPDEMLVVVAKYLNPSILIQLRKKNQRLNRITKRAGLCKQIAVEQIRIDALSVKLQLDLNLANSYGLEKNQFSPRLNFASHADLFKRILPKIKVTDEFEYSCTERFDDEAFQILTENTNSVKHCETLRYFCGPNQGLCSENQEKILSLFPKCRKLRVALPGYFGVTGMLSIEALSSRKWDYIVISSSEYFGGGMNESLNDHFLCTVAPRCEEFVFRSWNGTTYFTFNGIMTLLAKLSTKLPSRARWILGPIDIDVMDLNECIQKLKTVSSQSTEVGDVGRWWSRTIGYEVRIHLGKNVSVEFTLLKYLGDEFNNFLESARLKSNESK